jgi:hypothetical protein
MIDIPKVRYAVIVARAGTNQQSQRAGTHEPGRRRGGNGERNPASGPT